MSHMSIADKRHKVTIQQQDVSRNSYGEEVVEWSEYQQVFAQVQPLRGNERYAAQRLTEERITKFLIRYISGVATEMRIIHRNKAYYINSVLNMGMRNRELQILTTSGIEDVVGDLPEVTAQEVSFENNTSVNFQCTTNVDTVAQYYYKKEGTDIWIIVPSPTTYTDTYQTTPHIHNVSGLDATTTYLWKPKVKDEYSNTAFGDVYYFITGNGGAGYKGDIYLP